jgi:hypothetical protein
MTANPAHSLDAAMRFSLQIGCTWRGASDVRRWTQIMRTLLIVLSIALIGCRHERPDVKKVTLGVYVVSEQRIDPARFIDTPDFPRYGYIHSHPSTIPPPS